MSLETPSASALLCMWDIPGVSLRGQPAIDASRAGSMGMSVLAHSDLSRSADQEGVPRLAVLGPGHDPTGMFVVSEADAAAIRAAFEQRGEFAAAVELRRLFPGITDNAQARECARVIAGWMPLPPRSPRLPRGRRREP
jgi:hypothetical protein